MTKDLSLMCFGELAEKWHAPETKEKEITQVRESCWLWSESKTLGCFHWERAHKGRGSLRRSVGRRSLLGGDHSYIHAYYTQAASTYLAKKDGGVYTFVLRIFTRGVIFFCAFILSPWHCFEAHGAFSAAFVCYFTGPKRGSRIIDGAHGVLIWKLHRLHRNIHGKRATHMGHSRSLVHSKYIIHFIVRQIDQLTRET